MKQIFKRWLWVTSACLLIGQATAQESVPLFDLKQDDWFVMRADLNLTPENNRRMHQVNLDTRLASTYWYGLRYTERIATEIRPMRFNLSDTDMR